MSHNRKFKRKIESQNVNKDNSAAENEERVDVVSIHKQLVIGFNDLAVLNQKRILQLHYQKDSQIADSLLESARKDVEIGVSKQKTAQAEKRLALVQLKNAEEELRIVRDKIGADLGLGESDWGRYSVDWETGVVTPVLPNEKPGG